MWRCGIWGNFVKIWYFVNNCLVEVRISKVLLHIGDTYNGNYLQHSTFHFNSIAFQLNTDFPSQFCVFTGKSLSVTQRSVSQENAFIKSNKNPSLLFRRTIGSNSSFTLLNWKQFLVFKIAKFEFIVTVHYSLWAKCIQLWSLNIRPQRIESIYMQ